MQRHHEATAPDDTTAPKNDEARTTSRVAPGFKDHQTQTNSAIASPPSPLGPKELSTLQAEFARKGYELYPLGEHELYVTRWNLGRVLADIDVARRFLVQIGGAS